MSIGKLPWQFEDLNRFVTGWALGAETERNKKRRSSPMEEIQAFYDAILPRMEEIVLYLNQYPLDQIPDDGMRLLNLGLSFMEVSPAVELFHEPDESGVFDASRLNIIE